MSTARGGEQSPAEHGSREPGLDHLIRALTADGFPHELAGRDAALAAFRAASREKHRRPRFAPPRGLRMPTRLSTVAAALVAGITGVTAAAYAQALPAPVQHIAYSVLAPFGVPNSQGPVSPAPSRHDTGIGPWLGYDRRTSHGIAVPLVPASHPERVRGESGLRPGPHRRARPASGRRDRRHLREADPSRPARGGRPGPAARASRRRAGLAAGRQRGDRPARPGPVRRPAHHAERRLPAGRLRRCGQRPGERHGDPAGAALAGARAGDGPARGRRAVRRPR